MESEAGASFLRLTSPRGSLSPGREAGKSRDKTMLLPDNLIWLKISHAVHRVLFFLSLLSEIFPFSAPSRPFFFLFSVACLALKRIQMYFYTSIIIVGSTSGILTFTKYFKFHINWHFHHSVSVFRCYLHPFRYPGNSAHYFKGECDSVESRGGRVSRLHLSPWGMMSTLRKNKIFRKENIIKGAKGRRLLWELGGVSSAPVKRPERRRQMFPSC